MAVGVTYRGERNTVNKVQESLEDRGTHLRRASSYRTYDTDDVEYYLEFCGESVNVTLFSD